MKTNLLVVLAILAALILAGLYFNAAQATRYGDITNNYYTTEVTNLSQYYEENVGSEMAGAASLAIAHSSLHFGSNTRKLQLGIGGGYYASEESLVIGIGQLTDSGLFSGSIGRTHGHISGAVSWVITID